MKAITAAILQLKVEIAITGHSPSLLQEVHSVIRMESLTGRMVSASASEPVDREFYPALCSYSVFAIVCNASLLQVRPMVTYKLALTYCKLVSNLHSCSVKLAASLQICSARLGLAED
ncbi:hypothetical protein AVEN_127914-1 [Araneus ventricosus]|uniref:Uncharacterized protein n=1 Tax=Araneus ventricosus TaxID=182803 RepID=A0A4Y1ZZP9_ARAVE|nr:hypothetical protein AVEN_127914-1 [Araneus ventricosus]